MEDVKLPIGGDDVGMNNSIKELNKDEGGASMELLEDEMDSSTDEEIWRSQRERMNKALAANRNAGVQDPAKMYAAAQRLANVIEDADVEEFISEIERSANQIDLSAIFTFLGVSGTSLLHVATMYGKEDILRLLLFYVDDHLIAAQDSWEDTPLHHTARAGNSRMVKMLIRRASELPNAEYKSLLLRKKNKHEYTALHLAVFHRHVKVVSGLLREDLELVYWMNADQKSPLYLALDSRSPKIHDVLFSLSLDPSKIEGLPPVHGAVVRGDYGLVARIHEKDLKLFAMTDSKGGNVFHLAAYLNKARAFDLLQQETQHLAREQDENGDLPIHIASKMGHVELVNKLHPVSEELNRQGQSALHVAAKYGRTSAVRYMLRHQKLCGPINQRDNEGNTPLHLAAMHSQPAALIPLVLDKRIELFSLNHNCLTALDIALDRVRREYTLRKQLAAMVLASTTFGKSPTVNLDLLVLRPEARDEAFSIFNVNNKNPNMDRVKDVNDTRLLVATLVATVTFAAGFAVPGGFIGSDTASKDDQGMATMLHKRMFQFFTICNTIAMFCSMVAVVNLLWAQQNNVYTVASRHTTLPLRIALPAMSAAFLTGVTLTVGKLPWLANTIIFFGLFFFLVISGATLLEYPPFLRSRHRPIRIMVSWLVLAYIYLWGVETSILNESEDHRTASHTSTSQPLYGVGDDSATAKGGHAPHPPNH